MGYYTVHYGEDRIKIKKLIKQGHTRHCAYRIVWGDGECTCTRTGEITEKKLNELIKIIRNG